MNPTRVSQDRNTPRRSVHAWAVLALGVVCIGFSAIFVKLAAVPGTVSALYRLAMAEAVVLPMCLLSKPAWPRPRALCLALAAGLCFALDLALWNTAVMRGSSTITTLLAHVAPLWVGLASLVLLKEAQALSFWLGFAIALPGAGVLVGRQGLAEIHFGSSEVLATVASLVYAAYLLLAREVRRSLDNVAFMVLLCLSGTGFLLVVNLSAGQALTGFPARNWMALAGLALVTHLGGWLSINHALGCLPAGPVSVALLGQVLVTAMVARAILGERLGPEQILGGLLLVAGIACVLAGGDSGRSDCPVALRALPRSDT